MSAAAATLRGKIVWITGAGSGIGRAAAVRLAQAGTITILTGRRRAPLDEVAAAIEAAGGTALVAPANVADVDQVRQVSDLIVQRFGRLDLFAGCAGYNIPERRWSDLSPEQTDDLLRANLGGAFHTAAAALSLMRPARDGVLIHVASWSGRHIDRLSGPAYTAAKHGVVAMSHSINREVAGEGIRSCVICPGGVDTPLLDHLPVPLDVSARLQLLRPDDCADLIAYIAALPQRVRIDEVMITPTMQDGIP